MKNSIETYIVDAFTDDVFKGNPAGVCLLETTLTDDQMLSIAIELGLSETAFIIALPTRNKYAIRYFSPKMEIPLCGHATLASSKVLFEKDIETETIHFVNIQNLDLIVRRKGELIEMAFPSYDTVNADVSIELLHALGLKEVNDTAFNEETKILLLEISSSAVLRNLQPDFVKLISSIDSINGVLVTAPSMQPEFDFESRYFWPWSGTNEDPVTGATHTFLTKYWSTRLGKTKMRSFQCSHRSGYMEVELISDTKITIKSKAQIVLKGELNT